MNAASEKVATGGRNWYIVHTYSGFEERVRQHLRQRADALGFGDSIGEIRIPMETIVELKGGKIARQTVVQAWDG